MREEDKWRHDTDAMSAYGVLRDGTGFCVVKAASDVMAREIAKMHNTTPEILALVEEARTLATNTDPRFDYLRDRLCEYDAELAREAK